MEQPLERRVHFPSNARGRDSDLAGCPPEWGEGSRVTKAANDRCGSSLLVSPPLCHGHDGTHLIEEGTYALYLCGDKGLVPEVAGHGTAVVVVGVLS
jgi:hypothetical protein